MVVRLFVAVLMVAGFVLAEEAVPSAAPQPASGPSATPQRPTVSFNAFTVPARGWELELGGVATDTATAIPLFLKYGLSDRTEFELGIDAVRRVDVEAGSVSSAGDLILGLRSRLWEREKSAFAVVGWVKVPTAVEGAGSGETDFGAVAVYSTTLAGLSLDANLWLSGLGQENDSTLGQWQGVAAVWIPTRTCWTPFVEVALQRTAGDGDGGFIDVGAACGVTPKGVIDVGAGAGWSEGYPDWWFTVGWTVLWAPRP